MRPPGWLLQKVNFRQASVSEILEDIRSLAPPKAQYNRYHWWWQLEGEEVLETLAQVARGDAFLTPAEAVRTALRRRDSKVVQISECGVMLYKVMPIANAGKAVAEQAVLRAMPTELTDPPWENELPSLKAFREAAERQYLLRLMEKHGWHVSHAAGEASISRQYLHHLLARHKLHRPTAAPTPLEDRVFWEARATAMLEKQAV